MSAKPTVIPWPVAAPPHRPLDVRAIRRKLGLSQIAFARTFGFTRAALRNWERGAPVTMPVQRTLLTLIERDPDAVRRALAIPEPHPRQAQGR